MPSTSPSATSRRCEWRRRSQECPVMQSSALIAIEFGRAAGSNWDVRFGMPVACSSARSCRYRREHQATSATNYSELVERGYAEPSAVARVPRVPSSRGPRVAGQAGLGRHQRLSSIEGGERGTSRGISVLLFASLRFSSLLFASLRFSSISES